MIGLCSICGREKKLTKGLCPAHYQRLRRHSKYNGPIKKWDKSTGNVCKRCSTNPAKVRGLCRKCAYHFDSIFRKNFETSRARYRVRTGK